MKTIPTKALVRAARHARKRAYAPYSGFKVGAAVRTRNGKIFGGCNVENASYGLCNCAERTALFSAIAAGYKRGDFTHLAVVAATDEPCAPCGACRQVMFELGGPNLIVVQSNLKGATTTAKMDQLLPSAFGPDSLT
ncbi:cytidine deaminase [Povalibacter uvarum]|uniref:Cytidine deaminase n=1 Tax=Povalibacter uvarum TaxID=732238 RepID=A0A841HIX3_9GAMM|nr:cytidine deaminase [Povalibacter uvarum]MBB6092967.1 cytidine deaminase [Povalibacter uvarum]